MSDVPRFLETNPVPTLVLYGPEDHVVPRVVPATGARSRSPTASARSWSPDAGHFLQWEAADTFNRALTHFFL